MKKLFLITFLACFQLIMAQCKPTKVTTQQNGDQVSFYGGKIRRGGFGSNDKSYYNLYIAQVEEGTKGTVLIAQLYEYVDTKRQYNDAVNSFLNEANLKNNSSLDLILGKESLSFKPQACIQRPIKLFGSIIGYNVAFEAQIDKGMVETLQTHSITNFRLNIGGVPFERTFKAKSKKTAKLKNIFNCVNMQHIFENKQTDASQLELSEVTLANYKQALEGTWKDQASFGTTITFKEGTISYQSMGVESGTGTYTVAGKRLIMTSSSGNTISSITLFLQDMLILESQGTETQYERIK